MNNNRETNIKLIQIVETYPELWDHNNVKYGINYHTNWIWDKIGKEFNASGAACKERWEVIKKYFEDAAKSFPNKKIVRINEYELSCFLLFLLPVLKQQPKKSLIIRSSPQKQCYVICRETNGSTNIHKNKNLPETCCTQQGKRETTLNVNKRKSIESTNNSRETSFVDITNKKQKGNIVNLEEADLNFFQSLLPDMAKLDPRAKSQFKMSVMGQLNNLLYGTDQ